MADFSNLADDNNWDSDGPDFIFQVNVDYGDGHVETFAGLPTDVSLEEKYMSSDKPDKAHCPVCNKERTQTRCIEHPAATGCSYCHYKEDH